ncbi:galactose-1-epimerase [Zophobihabitans entericus]|uniref:Aldose 1-epimerase n=1 Tax=Zophobihabitans entericus TaxID=1635327 RepID=A0A6G9IC05_9GAMM|nr:galactose-1-epimerase [Zophobihabitans entericus]QIQ21244.1 galactose-1-epimerase [Zophobihabitans entericus]
MNITLHNHSGMTLQFSPIGATWLSCLLPLSDGSIRDVLLQCADVSQNSEAFIGSTIGRYSNRIKNATLQHNFTHYQLIANQGTHQLHGGVQGFHTQRWQMINQQQNRVIFGLMSENGEQGFPGEVKATVDFMLTEQNEVVINYIATTDKLTPINLTNHAYFNLDGGGDIKEHQLYVDADYYLPVDREGIPESDLKSVTAGDMDLRELQKISEHFLRSKDRQLLNGYDHAYLLNPAAKNLQQPAVVLVSSDQEVTLQVLTNKPAVQIYTGNNLKGTKGKMGIYQNYAGIAIETEFLPDSPNRPDWPHQSSWFNDKEFYCYTTIYRFSVGKK